MHRAAQCDAIRCPGNCRVVGAGPAAGIGDSGYEWPCRDLRMSDRLPVVNRERLVVRQYGWSRKKVCVVYRNRAPTTPRMHALVILGEEAVRRQEIVPARMHAAPRRSHPGPPSLGLRTIKLLSRLSRSLAPACPWRSKNRLQSETLGIGNR